MSKKHTLEKCMAIAKSKGGVCLSKEYKNCETKIRWKCKFGHQWYATYNSICKSWCPCCAGNAKHILSDAIALANARNGKCLSDKYINNSTKMKWECECGFIWENNYSHISRGQWCPKCAREKLNLYNKESRNTIGDARKLANINNGYCLSKEYVRAKCKLKWACAKNHIWEASYDNVRGGSWCPECSKGKSQKKLQAILEDILQEKSITIRPEWLKNPKTGYNLEIDIYFPKLKLAVEYQGRQHFEPVIFGKYGSETANNNFIKQKARDNIKRKLVRTAILDNKINYYIEVPYFEELVKKNIISYLAKNNIRYAGE